MRIRTIDGQDFDLPEGVTPDREYTSPFWAEYGSGTLPLSLTHTRTNLQLTGYAHDLRGFKNNRKIEVIIEDEGIERKGVMDVISSNLDVVVGYDESEVYDKIDTMNLADIPNLPSSKQNVYVLAEHLVNVYCSNENELEASMLDIEYRVFPVLLKIEENEGKEYYTILNRLTANNTPSLLGSDSYRLTTLVGGSPREVEYPVGYGMAPFIRLGYLLKYMIENGLGYKLKDNPFITDYQLRELCVLHNSIDMCCKGELNYKDMMPDATIGDMLDMIKARFGAHVLFDSNTMTARIVLISRALTASNYVDWSDKVASTIKESYEKYKYLVVKENRTDARGTETETYEEFCKKHYNTYNACNEAEMFTQWENEPHVKFRKATGEYLCHDLTKKPLQYFRISTSQFDQNRKEKELEAFELAHDSDLINTIKMDLPTQGEKVPMPYYDSDPTYITTAYEVGDKGEKEDKADRPIALAFYMGKGKRSGYWFGSTRCMDDEGEGYYTDAKGVVRRINLENYGEDGLFLAYLAKWDSVLRHAGMKTECLMDLSRVDLEAVKTDTIIHIDGVLYMYESIKLRHNDMSEVILRRISLQKPYNVESDHSLPAITAQLYYWQLYNRFDIDRNKNHTRVFDALVAETGIPSSSWFYVVDESNDTPVTSPEMSDFYGLKPPTSRYDSVARSYRCTYTYVYMANNKKYTRSGEYYYEAGVTAF